MRQFGFYSPSINIASCVELFIKANPELNERAIAALRNALPETQEKVVERGNLMDANNPSAVLISRITNATETGLVGITRSDLQGSAEEAWARICAKRNITLAAPAVTTVEDPASAQAQLAMAQHHMAMLQQQLVIQQQMAAQQSMAYLLQQQQLMAMGYPQFVPPQETLQPLQVGVQETQPASLLPSPVLAQPAPPMLAAPLIIPPQIDTLGAAVALQPPPATTQLTLPQLAAAPLDVGFPMVFGSGSIPVQSHASAGNTAPIADFAGYLTSSTAPAAFGAAASTDFISSAVISNGQLPGIHPQASDSLQMSFAKSAPSSMVGWVDVRSAPY